MLNFDYNQTLTIIIENLKRGYMHSIDICTRIIVNLTH